MSTIERAIAIAVGAHAGQVDKGGAPYILHPLRVMIRMTTNDGRIVAVLHDVVEDTEWSIEQLRGEGFSDTVLAALESVTRRPGETYDQFVDRAAQNEIGRRVKLADLEDNLDVSRIPHPTQQDQARIDKYRHALARLKATFPNPAS